MEIRFVKASDGARRSYFLGLKVSHKQSAQAAKILRHMSAGHPWASLARKLENRLYSDGNEIYEAARDVWPGGHSDDEIERCARVLVDNGFTHAIDFAEREMMLFP